MILLIQPCIITANTKGFMCCTLWLLFNKYWYICLFTDISSHVSIAVKTFLRYPSLSVLISSIRSFYKNMTVIIADDSHEPEKVTGEYIQHYILPPAQVLTHFLKCLIHPHTHTTSREQHQTTNNIHDCLQKFQCFDRNM